MEVSSTEGPFKMIGCISSIAAKIDKFQNLIVKFVDGTYLIKKYKSSIIKTIYV